MKNPTNLESEVNDFIAKKNLEALTNLKQNNQKLASASTELNDFKEEIKESLNKQNEMLNKILKNINEISDLTYSLDSQATKNTQILWSISLR